MHYRKIGRWGTRVSAIGLGSWLTYGGSVEEQTARACVKKAYEAGVTFFDTANVYAGGRAEEIYGRALSELRRDSIVLATKVYFPMGNGPNDRGLSRKHIREQINASLQRLGVDYVDLYQCHRYDPTTPLEETCSAMNDLVRAGKILYWGVSEWDCGPDRRSVRSRPRPRVGRAGVQSTAIQCAVAPRRRSRVPNVPGVRFRQRRLVAAGNGRAHRQVRPQRRGAGGFARCRFGRTDDGRVRHPADPRRGRPRTLCSQRVRTARSRNFRSPGYCATPSCRPRSSVRHAPNNSTRPSPRPITRSIPRSLKR